MKNYYVLDKDLSSDKDYLCKLQDYDPDMWPKLMTKEIIDSYPAEGLVYKAVEGSVLNDYPWTGSSFHVLASQKFLDVFNRFGAECQVIPSVIKVDKKGKRAKKVIEGYFTLNILDVVHCIDFELSEWKRDEFCKAPSYSFYRYALDESKIPAKNKIFWLGEDIRWLIVHSDVVKAFNEVGIVGIDFVPIEDFPRPLGSLKGFVY